DRESARRKLVHALESTRILGIRTNREYLIQLLESEEFRRGEIHTAWLPQFQPRPCDQSAFAAAAILYLEQSAKRLLPGVPPNYRNNPYRDPSTKLKIDGEEQTVAWRPLTKDRYAFGSRAVEIVSLRDRAITLDIDGLQTTCEIKQAGDEIFVWSAAG